MLITDIIDDDYSCWTCLQWLTWGNSMTLLMMRKSMMILMTRWWWWRVFADDEWPSVYWWKITVPDAWSDDDIDDVSMTPLFHLFDDLLIHSLVFVMYYSIIDVDSMMICWWWCNTVCKVLWWCWWPYVSDDCWQWPLLIRYDTDNSIRWPTWYSTIIFQLLVNCIRRPSHCLIPDPITGITLTIVVIIIVNWWWYYCDDIGICVYCAHCSDDIDDLVGITLVMLCVADDDEWVVLPGGDDPTNDGEGDDTLIFVSIVEKLFPQTIANCWPDAVIPLPIITVTMLCVMVNVWWRADGNCYWPGIN